MLMKFALAVLVFCASMVCGQRPSSAEFNLFCRILAKANDMMYGPDYVYDENADREIVKEMEVLYNATTDNMNEFRKTLWVTKDFFEEHPPPMDPKNRQDAHREIDKLIREGKEKIQENKKIALEVNEKINEAKLSVAKGIFGGHVTVVPKDDKNLTEILSDTNSTFEDDKNAANSCGHNRGKNAGKTLINDLFCLCAGGDANDAEGPCHRKIWPPKSWGGTNANGCCKNNNNNNCKCKWTQIKFGTGDSQNNPPLIQSFNESFQKIEQVCREEMMANDVNSKDMTALLGEYVGMIDMGNKRTDKAKKIFGHSERSAGGDKSKVTKCDGAQGEWDLGGPEKHNNNICVDYTNNQNKDGKTYNIPWHTKFKNYTDFMKQAKDLEDQILKNRAALLLLKSEAWVAYSREKDDETSNLDDMNVGSYPVKTNTMAENKQGEPTNQEREYIDVPSQSTQGSQPSQPAPSNKDGRKYHYISSTEATQEEAPVAPAGGGEPPYIYVSSTGTPSQQTPAPETPSPTQQDPPTQSAKRLREENKTGE